jgi:hypothetical protein
MDNIIDSLFVDYLIKQGAYYDDSGVLIAPPSTYTAEEMNKLIADDLWDKKE